MFLSHSTQFVIDSKKSAIQYSYTNMKDDLTTCDRECSSDCLTWSSIEVLSLSKSSSNDDILLNLLPNSIDSFLISLIELVIVWFDFYVI